MADIRDIWLHAHNMLRTARQMLNESLSPLGLSSAEGNVLLHLLTQGEGVDQEQLAAQLDISKPAISRTLDSLEEKRFVVRERGLQDQRVRLVRLTEKARSFGAEVEQAYNHLYEVALVGISKKELDEFFRTFARISGNFQTKNQ